ncbi:LysR family transcriptional regulator [uncultured Roseovarius sp.]|uniref:LysR family transcriptional regulator n=1 Tax=uncultured Roseovarius sp. TaxID=293344 RepID=UPI002602D2F9|nr:LysR family transcriptional regulator [uncultured Roseovarius sp.]
MREVNWNLFRTFCAIVEQEGVTKAARRLDTSQPSVSQALQKLEAQLGCTLVVRGMRKFSLTEHGSRIYQECAKIQRCTSRIDALVDGLHEDTYGELRLPMISNVASPLIDEAIRLYHQRYPSVVWQIEIRDSQDIVRHIAMEKGGLGICLLANPVVGLECTHLFRDEFGVFCGAEHPLFGSNNVSVRALQKEPFVVFSCAQRGGGMEPMEALREGAGLGQHVIGSSLNLEEVRRMIVSGLGIGILPLAVVREDIKKNLLWKLPIADSEIGADIYLVRHLKIPLTKPEQRFVDVIDEILRLYPVNQL